MRDNQSNLPVTKLRFTYFTVLVVSLAVLNIFAGCAKQDTQQNAESNKAAPTPKPSPTPDEGRDLSDTPIVISGGSTEIDFDHDVFKAVNATKFSSANSGVFTSVKVYDDSENATDDDYISFVIPGSGRLTVKLTYQSQAITISNESSGKVETEFDTTALKARPTPGKLRKHYSRRIRITGMEVKSGGTPVVCQNFQGIPMPPAQCRLPGNKFTIAIGLR